MFVKYCIGELVLFVGDDKFKKVILEYVDVENEDFYLVVK